MNIFPKIIFDDTYYTYFIIIYIKNFSSQI